MYGLQESNDVSLSCSGLALAMLVFMSPTIFAYGRIMGASWNMLLIGNGELLTVAEIQLTQTSLGSLTDYSLCC